LRKLATEAAENGWMDPTMAGIARVRGGRRLGIRVGKWATAEEVTAQAPEASSVKGKRDRAILSVLIGCPLRRGELVGSRSPTCSSGMAGRSLSTSPARAAGSAPYPSQTGSRARSGRDSWRPGSPTAGSSGG
jgi:hypothetical protein